MGKSPQGKIMKIWNRGKKRKRKRKEKKKEKGKLKNPEEK